MTTACIELPELKSFLRIDHDADDKVLEMIAEAATELIETRCRRPVIGDTVAGRAICASVETVPASVRLAAGVLSAFIYENREATDEELRSRVLRQAALDQYILWGPSDEDGSGTTENADHAP